MKSIYLRNFTAMAVLVIFCLMLICLSFVGIGRMHLVRVLRGEMIASAEEVARIAAAVMLLVGIGFPMGYVWAVAHLNKRVLRHYLSTARIRPDPLQPRRPKRYRRKK